MSTTNSLSWLQELIEKHFDGSSEPVIITDANPSSQKIVYVNAAYEKMSGWQFDEIKGKKAKFMQGEKTNPKVISRLRDAIHRKEDFTGATFNYRKNREEYYVEWNIHYFKDDKTGLDYFISVQHDLSIFKQAMDNLKKTSKEFRNKLKTSMDRSDQQSKNELREFFTDSYAISVERQRRAKIKQIGELLSTEVLQDSLFIDPGNISTSAKEYLSDYYVDSDTVCGIRDALDEIDAAIIFNRENPEKLASELALLFGDLATNIFSLEGFVEVSSSLTQLATAFSNAERVEPKTMQIIESLIGDLTAWHKNVFVSQSTDDIHALDQSIIGSATQIGIFVNNDDQPQSNQIDVELF